jgi:hypothetical protein
MPQKKTRPQLRADMPDGGYISYLRKLAIDQGTSLSTLVVKALEKVYPGIKAEKPEPKEKQ